jgi:hypothetical protein
MGHYVLQWFNDYSRAVSAMAAVITATIAVITLIRTSSDSRSRSQPAVIAEIRRAPDADTSFDLVIRNAGPTIARDVQVTFDPPLELPDGQPEDHYALQWIIKRYEKIIPMLAPGQELSNTWWFGAAVDGSIQNVEPTPDQVLVRIRYRGRKRRWRTDEFPLDMDAHTRGTTTTSSSSFKGRLHSIDQAINMIANKL